MAAITEVTDTNFQAEVLENDMPVLVDFWAPWCGPCRMIAPILEEIAQTREDLRIVKLNVDDNQQTAAQYQVLAIPTMILFRNGQEAKRIQGAMPKKRIEAELEPALASEALAAAEIATAAKRLLGGDRPVEGGPQPVLGRGICAGSMWCAASDSSRSTSSPPAAQQVAARRGRSGCPSPDPDGRAR